MIYCGVDFLWAGLLRLAWTGQLVFCLCSAWMLRSFVPTVLNGHIRIIVSRHVGSSASVPSVTEEERNHGSVPGAVELQKGECGPSLGGGI